MCMITDNDVTHLFPRLGSSDGLSCALPLLYPCLDGRFFIAAFVLAIPYTFTSTSSPRWWQSRALPFGYWRGHIDRLDRPKPQRTRAHQWSHQPCCCASACLRLHWKSAWRYVYNFFNNHIEAWAQMTRASLVGPSWCW
jgi:hypothetical protein